MIDRSADYEVTFSVREINAGQAGRALARHLAATGPESERDLRERSTHELFTEVLHHVHADLLDVLGGSVEITMRTGAR